MNKCVLRKVWEHVWGGVREFVEISFWLALFAACCVACGYALVGTPPNMGPKIALALLIMRIVALLLMLIILIRGVAKDVRNKLNEFKDECE